MKEKSFAVTATADTVSGDRSGRLRRHTAATRRSSASHYHRMTASLSNQQTNTCKIGDSEKMTGRAVITNKHRMRRKREGYCIAGILLSIVVTIFVNGPQFVSAGFACLSNPCVFGVCVDDLNSTYSCYCIDGYTGSQCQTNWDECWSSPCQNGAVCIDGVAHYNCSCPEGFAGVNCEENLDECASNPCQNGGLCNDRDNSYTCSCAPGYLGKHCETDVAVCEAADATITGGRCQNGGSCVEGPGLEFTCQCPSGWQGQRCEVERNECESSPCENGAVCVDKLDGYLCACPMKFTGTNCEEAVLECDASPCHNNALCLMEEGLPVCYCVPDYHGEHCEDQYDECQLGPRCLNGGTCIDGVDEFTCSCPAGLTGLLCECLILDDATDEKDDSGVEENSTRWPNLNCNYTRNDTDQMFTTEFPQTTMTTSIPDGNYPTEEPPPLTLTATTSDPLSASSTAEDDGASSTAHNAYSSPPTTTLTATGDTATTITGEAVIGQISTTISPPPQPPITITANDLETTTAATGATEPVTISGGVPLSTSSDVGDYGSESDKFTTILLPAEPTTGGGDATTVGGGGDGHTEATTTAEAGSGPGQVTTLATGPTDASTLFATTTGQQQQPTTTMSHAEGGEGEGVITTTSKVETITEEGAVKETTVEPTTQRQTEGTPTTTTRADWETPPPPTTMGAAETMPPTDTGYPHPHFFTDVPQVVTTTMTPTMTPTTTRDPIQSFTTTTTAASPFDGTITNFTIGLDCKRMPCLNGATCVMTNGGARCLCSYNREGLFCEKTIQIRRAAFAGDSYVSHRFQPRPATADDPQEAELERMLPMDVVFRGRTRATEGLIMLAIGQGTHGSHYMALFLQRGLLQFQFSCGLQTMLLSELEAPINTGHEMIIHASLDFSRNFSHCNASLKVNDSLALSGDQSTWLGKALKGTTTATSNPAVVADRPPAILHSWLHLGGAPQAPIGLINELPGASTGFTGCLHSLRINGLKRDLFGDAVDGYGITECGSLACLSNPCRNGARCVEVQPASDDDELEDNTIGLSAVNRNGGRRQQNHHQRRRSSNKVPSRWTSTGEGESSAEQSNRYDGIIPDGWQSRVGEGGGSDGRQGSVIMDDYHRADDDYLLMEEENNNWQCKCPTGYIGATCEISVCDNNPCQYGGTCIPYPGSGYLCLCPFGKHGHYCEHNLEISQPTFSGSVLGLSSYVSYPVPIPLDYEMDLSFRIAPSTLNQIALLAFVGQPGYHDDKSDHLAVSFVKGYVMLTWNVGGGPRRIFTPRPLQDAGASGTGARGQSAALPSDVPAAEHVIHVRRVGRQAWLSVDNNRLNVTGRAPGGQSKMEVAPVLYLGGHSVANFSSLPHDLPLHSGFEGCIYDVELRTGHVSVPLATSKGVHGRGVGQCNTRECHRHACQHDGACLQHGATFTCICQEGWYGPLCAHPSNPCDAENNRCHSASTCVPLVTNYECDCPTGKTGKNCDVEIKSLSDVSLTGRRSYLAIDWPSPAARSSGNARNLGRISENEIPSDKYRMSPQVMRRPLEGATAASSPSNGIELKFVNELGQPVAGRHYYGQPPVNRRARYESASSGGDQYMLTSAPADKSAHQQRLQFYSIEFQLRPLSERGLLVFFGAFDSEVDEAACFVSLSLQGGVVEFRISARKDHLTVLRSNRVLAIGEWHKIRFSQSGRRLSLWVEGSAVASTTDYNGLFIPRNSRIYMGGLPDLAKLPLSAISGFPVPYRGCVRQVMVSGVRMLLNETNIRESRNIQDCDGTSCGGDLCDMGGHCWLDNKMQPHCKCPESARGDRCQMQESCLVVKCKNGGRCLKNGQCNCPNGYGGYYCEIALSILATPSFNGRSYLRVPAVRAPGGAKEKRHGLPHSSRLDASLVISLNFSTTDTNGLLLWSSRGDKEFLGLGLENGHLKMASNWLDTNDSSIDIPTGGYLSDGGWHNLHLMQSKNVFELRIDDREIFNEDGRERGTFNGDIMQENEFYIGGFADSQPIATATFNRFHHPFRGCLQEVYVNSEGAERSLDFSKLEGQNIGICDLEDNFV